MEMGQKLPEFVMKIVVILVVLFLFIFILDQITGIGIIRRMVCSVFFWVPFGNIYSNLVGGCEAIPV